MKQIPDFILFRKVIFFLKMLKAPCRGLFLLLLLFSSTGLHAAWDNTTPASGLLVVEGKVTDSLGTALEGVSVKFEGTDQGTITNNNGEYRLTEVNDNSVLVFSYVGFITQTVPAGGRSRIDIVLHRNNTGLGEVIVVGYGTQKKATITGAISTIKGDVLQESPAINFTNTLAGRMPGLVAMNTTGEPGKDNATIRIRGANTMGNNSALIVIDGIAGRDMNGLRPEDIESVTVLKDASGAIYGARAANGVILITTKRGRLGKPEVTLNLNYGINKPTVIPEMADAAS